MNKKEFKDELETWLENFLDENLIPNQNSKIIRDPVHGIYKFNKWEVAFLDQPLIQRLRNIKQNAFAYFVYPGANQTRFDHTLGVAILTEEYINALRNKKMDELNKERGNNLRLAAILHDIGHGPFSHLTEEIYSTLDPIKDLLKEKAFSSSKQNVKGHELLSFFIIKSKKMTDFFAKANLHYSSEIEGELNQELIANSIIGRIPNKRYKYCQDIINGAFDADKLDYIQRDCYFTGLKMGLDVDRIFFNLEPKRETDVVELALDINGCHDLEQLFFNKLLLFPSLYHHHKIRACNCMFKSIFEIIHNYDLEVNKKKFDNPIDFLDSSDNLFFSWRDKPEEIQEMIRNLMNRQIFKRALVISRDYLVGDKDAINANYKDLIKWEDDPGKIVDLRKQIADSVEGVTIYDIGVDFPSPPSLREASQCHIKIKENTYESLDKSFPSSGWLNTFFEHKWRGYIFCPPIKKIREEVQQKSREILKQDYGIELDENCILSSKIR